MTPFLLFFVALATASPMRRQTMMLDADGDGLISKQEVMNAMTLHDALVALDIDDDGFLYLPQIVELFGSGDIFYQLNNNGDDHLTIGEFQHGLNLGEFFDLFDKNGDGVLDNTESYQMNYIYNTIQNPDAAITNALDANGDGKLSKLEVLGAFTLDEAIVAIDMNGDGFLTAQEMFPVYGNDSQALLDSLDTDMDGQLSYDEVKGGTSLDTIFDIFDVDGDGYLSLNTSEVDGVLYVYNAIKTNPDLVHGGLDADGDGKISLAEVELVMTMHQALVAADQDGDNHLNEQEFVMYVGDQLLFNILDHNSDGTLSFGEMHNLGLDTLFNYQDTNGDGFLDGTEADKITYIYDMVMAADQ
ncbi:PREDICTED: calmodulin-like protein 12 [Branchiostoma belcheri]|uniref:Calmodulin-like protein 12 n=1 Tax=Branchiostoma belcheri TaxID=7741 RepID=A0A6P5AF80_BRABE|nr:PREDICTED: calmodulin-like protein 12 [Branchiostoma belcheri]